MSLTKDLTVRMGSDTSGFDRGLKKVNSGVSGLKNNAASANTGITKLAGGIGSMVKAGLAIAGISYGLRAVADSVKSYIRLETSVIRVNDLFKDASKYVTYFAENTAKSFGMAEASAYQYAAVYGNLLKNVTTDETENAKVSIAMLKASAVVASKTGRTMDDVMQRIRSGLMGNIEAIEDLGIYAQIGMIETTDAFKKIADGRSWEQLNYIEQQQIRTLSILEQAQKQFGTEVQQGSAYSLAVLSGAFTDLTANAGRFLNAALQPIIEGLTELVYWANSGLKSLSALLGLKIDVSTTNTAATAQAALTDETNETLKAQEKLAGFDKFNDITKSKASGAATSSGSGAADSVFTGIAAPDYIESSSSSLDGFAAKLKIIKESEPFTTVSQAFQTAWSKIRPAAEQTGLIFSGVFDDIRSLTEPFVEWFKTDFIDNITTKIQVAGDVISGLLDSFNLVFSDIWNVVLKPFIDNFITVLLPVFTKFDTEVIKTFGALFNEAKAIFDVLWSEAIKPVLERIMIMWTGLTTLIAEKWNLYGKPIFESIREAVSNMSEIFLNAWNTYLKPFWDNFMETIDWLWTEHLQPLWNNFSDFIVKLIQGALDIYNGFVAPLVNWFIDKFGPAISSVLIFVGDVFGSLLGIIIDIASGIYKALGGIIDFIAGVFTGDWERAWSGIKDFFGGIWDAISGVAKGALNIIIDVLNLLIRGINSFKIDIPDWIKDIPLIGQYAGKTIGFNIPEIPKFATGGVVYGQVQALVGDNFNARQDPEVVSPLSTLKGMIVEALLQKEIATSGNGETRIVLQLENGEILADMLIDPMNKKAKNLGYAPVFAPANG